MVEFSPASYNKLAVRVRSADATLYFCSGIQLSNCWHFIANKFHYLAFHLACVILVSTISEMQNKSKNQNKHIYRVGVRKGRRILVPSGICFVIFDRSWSGSEQTHAEFTPRQWVWTISHSSLRGVQLARVLVIHVKVGACVLSSAPVTNVCASLEELGLTVNSWVGKQG